MTYTVKIYSPDRNEIKKFLELFFENNIDSNYENLWKKDYHTPIDFLDIISTFADNKEKFKANMWISLDKNLYILITEKNINSIIKYIYERFPY